MFFSFFYFTYLFYYLHTLKVVYTDKTGDLLIIPQFNNHPSAMPVPRVRHILMNKTGIVPHAHEAFKTIRKTDFTQAIICVINGKKTKVEMIMEIAVIFLHTEPVSDQNLPDKMSYKWDVYH